MTIGYNRIAGQSLGRLAALSDGIFAVAMTLLILDLHTPVADASVRFTTPLLWTSQGLAKEEMLLSAFRSLVPHLLPYLMSFLTLGIFWVAQQTLVLYFARSDRYLTWLQLCFLLMISLMPFSTGLLSEFLTYRLALMMYWVHLLLLGGISFASWRYAQHAGLLKDEATPAICSATERRIVLYQVFYTVVMLFCVINTYISLVFLILLQLNSAVAPRIGRLDRV